jgi:hydroxyacyl-ACP dehydratase HTD2-like protein with hotdog domain
MAMVKQSYITPEIRALLAQEAISQSTEPVEPGKIRRFAKALGFQNPRYYDLENCRPIAPLTFVFSVNHDSLGEVDESGRPTNRVSLPPSYGPAIRGGNKYQFFRPVQVGDQILIRRKITDLQEKEGHTGSLLILTYDLEYSNQNRELLGINTESLIFRVTPKGEQKREQPQGQIFIAPGEGREIPSFQVNISKVQMMIYAAATWNPYQLHWDSDYAIKHGFPEINIPGAMFGDYQAEMLVRWIGNFSALKSLAYSIRAMAFPGDTLICKGMVRKQYEEQGNPYTLCLVWVENQKKIRLVDGTAVVSLV